MIDLDFSIRDSAALRNSSTFQIADCAQELRLNKREAESLEDATGDDLCNTLQTPEHIKRIRRDIEQSFDSHDRESRVRDVQPFPPPQSTVARFNKSNENPFKHAGALKEYGGVKGFVELLRKQGVSATSLR